jgi:Flp pilus assembly protein TadD
MSRLLKQVLGTSLFVVIAGCNAGGLTPNQKAEANKQWNDARANVLASLANDQYKNGNFDKCRETLDQAIRLEPANANFHLLGAKVAVEQGKLEEAQAHLEEARRLDPKNAEVDYLSGVVLQRWQQPQKACEAYAAATQKNPLELSYLLAEAEMRVQLGRPAEALSLLQSKASAFEHSAVLRDEMGQICMLLNQPGEAVEQLSVASTLAPEDESISEHFAFALLTDKRFDEAAEVFSRLVKDNANRSRADLFAGLGECQCQTGRVKEAVSSFKAATVLQPSIAGYWIGLSRSMMQLGDIPGADAAVRKAITLDDRRADAKCLLGYIELQANALPASLAAFKEAADLDPTDGVSLCLQGYVLQKMGRSAEARTFYRQAQHINPGDELANRLLAGLDPHD